MSEKQELLPYRELAAKMARTNQITEIEALRIMKEKIEKLIGHYSKEIKMIDELMTEVAAQNVYKEENDQREETT